MSQDPLKNVLRSKSISSQVSELLQYVTQCLVAGAVMILAASCGMPAGYTSILLPQLQHKYSNVSTFHYDKDLSPWIVSVYPAAIPVGTLLSGYLMDKIGRRVTLMLSTIPLVFGWCLIALANNLKMIIIARIIIGVSVGLTAVPGQVLIGETAEPKLRGILSSVPYVSYSIGVLLVYIFGSFFTWTTVALICIVFPIIALWTLTILPESPPWLLRQNRGKEAFEALCWLRYDVLQAHEELELLSFEVRKIDKKQNESKFDYHRDLKSIFTNKTILSPFVILNVFNILQILSGTHLIIFYAIDILGEIFEKQTQNAIIFEQKNLLIAILTAIIRCTFTIIGSILLYFIGRRPLALISCLGSALSSLAISVIITTEMTTRNYYCLELAILVYIAMNTAGFLLLPSILLGELYPIEYRAVAGAITLTVYNLFLSFVTKMFPILNNLIHIEGIFFIFSGCSACCAIFLYFYLPETRNKSLVEIETFFNNKPIRKCEKSISKTVNEI